MTHIEPTLANADNDSVSDFFNQDQLESPETDVPEQPVVEQDDEDLSPQLTNQQTNLAVLIFQIIISLALIIGLIYGLLKFFNRSGRFSKQGENLESLGGLSLGASKSVQLIKIGTKVYLVGVGDDVSLLTEITDEEVRQQLIEQKYTDRSTQIPFLNQLKLKSLQKSRNQQDNDESSSEDKAFASLFKGELDAMKKKRAEIRANDKEEE